MAAVFPPLLSDQPPDLAKRAEFGGRFHYWRGYSGRRYLFSVVPPESLADFRSAVVILAEPTGDGCLAAHTITVLDEYGRPRGGDRRWPSAQSTGARVLVHLLATGDGERWGIVDDLSDASSARLAA